MTREDEYFCSLSANDQKHYLEYENMVKNNEKPQANNGWIKCSERLPESSELVLVYVKDSPWGRDYPGCVVAFYDDTGEGWFTDGNYAYDSLYWQRIPPPPTA